ncbi:hypothetical protein [Mycobacteroides chelonae]|uniref:hypothetical protein n=1 Tax=Mycobacteroides chelonae TaxID=1774 RepID=UPI0009925E46|nr:hypothetical protein [Mycobacteroides chelonae]
MIEIIETVELETYEILTAAIDTGERWRDPTVMEIITGLDLEDAIKDLVARGEVCAVYAWHQQAWREAVEVSGIDPRNGWMDESAAEAALVDFFTDRDARACASAVLKEAV